MLLACAAAQSIGHARHLTVHSLLTNQLFLCVIDSISELEIVGEFRFSARPKDCVQNYGISWYRWSSKY